MAEKRPARRATFYHHYILREDEHPGGLLALQTPYGRGKRAHFDEHLFIVTHQAFELWFNQMIEDIMRPRTGAAARIEAGAWGPAAATVRRLARIARLLTEQYGVIETLSPSDFLKFRDVLRPSSGYDSAQFRALELASGLRNDGAYLQHLTGLDPEAAGGPEGLAHAVDGAIEAAKGGKGAPLRGYSIIKKMAAQGDLSGLRLVRRTLVNPSLRDAAYAAVLAAEVPEPRWQKAKARAWVARRAKEWDLEREEAKVSHGPYEVSMDAARAAQIVRKIVAMYQGVTDGEGRAFKPWPLLDLLEALIEYDEVFRNLRAVHVNMVLRVIGGKPGTGGSTGARYLQTTLGYEFFPLLWRARDHMEGP